MTPPSKEHIEEQKLKLDRERLNFEKGGTVFKYLAILGGIATFFWTSFAYFDGLRREHVKKAADERAMEEGRVIEQAKATAVQRVISMEPFLNRQLALFQETTQVVAFIATSPESEERKQKEARFWQLYWGELALVEHGDVETAMKHFGDALKAKAASDVLEQLSLKVTYACRDELAESWNEPSWRRNK